MLRLCALAKKGQIQNGGGTASRRGLYHIPPMDSIALLDRGKPEYAEKVNFQLDQLASIIHMMGHGNHVQLYPPATTHAPKNQLPTDGLMHALAIVLSTVQPQAWRASASSEGL